MNGKGIYIFFFVISIAVFANCVPGSYSSSYSSASSGNLSHNLIVGNRLPGDHLVFRQNVFKDSSWFRVTTHQQTFNVSKPYRITQVRAMDQKSNGSGATASLLHGGPGTNTVTLRFKSQRGHRINFVVELYGRP